MVLLVRHENSNRIINKLIAGELLYLLYLLYLCLNTIKTRLFRVMNANAKSQPFLSPQKSQLSGDFFLFILGQNSTLYFEGVSGRNIGALYTDEETFYKEDS